jgi:hypothetical protein
MTKFRWNSSSDGQSGVHGYILQYANNGEFIGPTTHWVIDTVYVATLSDTTYYWRVRAVDMATNPSGWSEVWTFEIDSEAPDAPMLYTPVGGEWLDDPLVFFDWGEVTLVGPGEGERTRCNPLSTEVSYVFLLSTVHDFGDTVRLDTLDTDSTTMILPENPYYWQVYAFDGAGNTSPASSDSFGVDITGPTAPALIAPSDYDSISLGVGEMIMFEWCGASDAVSGVDRYELAFTDTTFQIYAPETCYVMTPYPWTEFTWKVRAHDAAGNPGPWSEEWHLFLTEIAESGIWGERPGEFYLQTVGPNPARDRVSLMYQVPRASGIELKVYNPTGGLVNVIECGNRSPNLFRVDWDCRNLQGDLVSPGVYVVILRADGRRFAEKVVIAR